MRPVERHEVLGSLISLKRPPRPSSTPHWPCFGLSCKMFFSFLPRLDFWAQKFCNKNFNSWTSILGSHIFFYASGGFLVDRRAYVALSEQVLGWPNFITTQMFTIISTRKAPKTEYRISNITSMVDDVLCHSLLSDHSACHDGLLLLSAVKIIGGYDK